MGGEGVQNVQSSENRTDCKISNAAVLTNQIPVGLLYAKLTKTKNVNIVKVITVKS